jgi:hypothetical protein
MTKRNHLFSSKSNQQREEHVTIGDVSTLPVYSCDIVVIDHAKYEDVVHVPWVGLNFLFIYHIAHTNKKVGIFTEHMGFQRY